METGGSDRMTALDAAFYYLERTGQLLHVGGVYTVDGALDFRRLTDDIGARLHLIPRYTQRVLPVPFNLGHPTWEPDPRFSLRNHVFRHTLRGDAGDEQLARLAARLFAEPLDRARPLWELHLIDGYKGDGSAIFAKVHHCMIDGVSGVQLLGVMFDPSPNPVPPPPSDGLPPAPPLPSPLVQLGRAVRDSVRTARRRAQLVADHVRRPGRALAEVGEVADAVGQLARIMIEPTPRTPWNGHVSTLRHIGWTTLSLNEVKAIKNRLGGTVNDVVLTVITSALRAYLEGHGVRPDRIQLRAMVPVNVRSKPDHLRLGNRIAMMVAPLPVGIYEPHERLRQVQAAMAQLKEGGESARMTRMIDLLSLLPPPVQKPLGWLQVQAAPINTICTNVPGPPVSLYVQGRRLETLVPLVPLAQGVGLAFAILSYADTLTIGITCDPALVAESEPLCELLQAALEELRNLAGVERVGRRGQVRPERQRRAAVAPSQVA